MDPLAGPRASVTRWCWALVRPRSSTALIATYAAGYALAAVLGRLTVPPGTHLALIWPAAGVAFLWLVAIIQRHGLRSRQYAASVALVVGTSLVLNAISGLVPAGNLGVSLANAVQATVAATLYLRIAGRGLFDERRHLTALLIAAVAGAVTAIPVGPVPQVLLGAPWWVIAAWVLRNVSGIFIVAILGLRLMRRHPVDLPRQTLRQALLLLVATVVVVWVAFWVIPSVPLSFLFVSMVIWVAATRTVNETVVHVLSLSLASILLTLADIGPFASHPMEARAGLGQGLSLVLCLTALSIVLGREEQARLVSRIRASEEATIAQAVLMDRIIGTMDDGLVVFTQDGGVLLANDAARHMLHWSPQDPDLEIASLALLSTGDPGEPGVVDDVLAGRQPDPVDILPAHPAGEAPRVLSARAVGCQGEEGVMQVVVVLLDVTEQRRRTAELTSFAGVIAHDLLNPLGAVEGWTEMLAEEIEEAHPGLGAEALTRISGSSTRMRGIIAGLLSYSVAREGELSVSDFAVEDVGREIADARVSAALATGGRVPRVVVDAPERVRADRALIAQVIDNLVGNSAKYTQEGAVPQIEVRSAPAVQGWVTVTVADRGIGLPPGQEEAVFAEFHRVPEHRGLYLGTGLGLSICRRVVERHGGRISAHRRDGGGSVFVLTLPAAPVAQPAGESVGAGPVTGATDRSGAEGTDRTGTDGSGTDRSGIDARGTVRSGADRVGADRSADLTAVCSEQAHAQAVAVAAVADAVRAAERGGAPRGGVDRGGVDRAGADRAGADRGGIDRVAELGARPGPRHLTHAHPSRPAPAAVSGDDETSRAPGE